jgi:hypothetical protein
MATNRIVYKLQTFFCYPLMGTSTTLDESEFLVLLFEQYVELAHHTALSLHSAFHFKVWQHQLTQEQL